jgi:hypothetical protein
MDSCDQTINICFPNLTNLDDLGDGIMTAFEFIGEIPNRTDEYGQILVSALQLGFPANLSASADTYH